MGKLTKKRQKQVQRFVEFQQNYWITYDSQYEYLSYGDHTLIDDALYAIGVGLWGDEAKFADGFRKTKERLRKHLETP